MRQPIEPGLIRTFRYRLYPNKAQEAVLDEQLRLCRNLYNCALEERKEAYRKAKVARSFYDQSACLPIIKDVLPEYKDVYAQVLQNVLKRLDKAFKAFFSRIKAGKTPGFPRFQGRDRYDSLCYPQAGFSVSERTAYFGKIGNVPIKLHRPIEGKIKTATIKRENTQWYVSYICEVPPQPLPSANHAVGVDVGTAYFAITSDGEFTENPRYFQKAMKKLRVAQRSVSRKKNKRSHRRRKAVQHVAKIHRKISRQRLDFHHKVAVKLIRENDLIAHEDLNVGGMGRGNLARGIHDVGWAQFFSLLAIKAECAGRRVIRVDPRYTSQACNKCGHTEKANRLSQSRFVCQQCGHAENADVNAARNILARALPSVDHVSQQAERSLRNSKSVALITDQG